MAKESKEQSASMAKLNIRHQFEIEASDADLFKALADGVHIRNWWTSESNMEPKIGAMGNFVWNGHGWKVEMVIRKLVPNKLIEWKCVSSNMQGTDGWVGSTIRFSVASVSKTKSTLDFVQEDYKDSPCFNVCTDGWRFVLGTSLKAYVETGKGLPYKEPSA